MNGVWIYTRDRHNISSNDAILKLGLNGREVFIQASKEKTVCAARKAKRILENPFTEAQKARKVGFEAKRQRNIQWTADEKCDKLIRLMVERRCAAGEEDYKS